MWLFFQAAAGIQPSPSLDATFLSSYVYLCSLGMPPAADHEGARGQTPGSLSCPTGLAPRPLRTSSLAPSAQSLVFMERAGSSTEASPFSSAVQWVQRRGDHLTASSCSMLGCDGESNGAPCLYRHYCG